ncbi:MAG: DUF2092 domain-containing protein [Hyphomicrobium sp.]|jgi:outer membrane lipoprotein-sorting protein
MRRALLLTFVLSLLCPSSMPCYAEEPARAAPPSQAAPSAVFGRLRDYLVTSPLDFDTSFVARNETLGTTRGTARNLIKHPNLFRIDSTVGKHSYVVVSDGRLMTIYLPDEHKYAELPAPGSAREGLGLVTGLMAAQSSVLSFIGVIDDVASGREGYKVSAAPAEAIGGRHCDGFTIVDATLDITYRWKVWLEKKDVALPCKVESGSDDQIDFGTRTNEFSWKQNPVFPQDAFKFAPPAGAKKVDVGDLDLSPPADVHE